MRSFISNITKETGEAEYLYVGPEEMQRVATAVFLLKR